MCMSLTRSMNRYNLPAAVRNFVHLTLLLHVRPFFCEASAQALHHALFSIFDYSSQVEFYTQVMAALLLRLVAFIGLACIVLAAADASSEPATYLRHQRRAMEKPHVYKRTNISTSDISQAQSIVDAAVAQQGEYNSYRVANPRRNNYYASDLPIPNSVTKKMRRRADESTAPTLNSTVLAAAALVAEHHAAQQAANGTLHKIYKQPTSLPRFDDSSSNAKRAGTDYWLAEITHSGLASMGQDDSWLVYRDVTDSRFAGGAKGDGVTDDTAAINAAIKYGGNCGDGCLSSSTKGALVYFPPGTYLISTPIEAYYYSQLVGNPNDMPIIKTSASFIGLGAIETDVYEPNANGDEWYINQSNFYRQVRNFIIDIEDTKTEKVAGLHWQVAQATSLTNVYVYASSSTDTTSMGMFTENGSSGFMGECFFSGGAYGIYGGNQQYTMRSFEFVGQTTAGICLIWDWGWTWSQLLISDTPIGILLINPEDTSGPQAGSIYVMDSYFDGVATAIHANARPATILDSSVITLDNIGVSGVTEMVTFSDGTALAIPAQDTDFIIVGNVEADGSLLTVSASASYGMWSVNVEVPATELTSSYKRYARDSYFYKSRPQYEDLDVGSIINVKDLGAKGDGVTDDTSVIGKALALATESNLIYFPAGSYIVTQTLQIDPGTRITGEVWSQLVASGDFFADMANSQPMLKVGAEGQTGVVEITDMLFTSVGALPGLILVEWNMGASDQGSAALWDAHFRVGGAAGTKLQVADCPKGAAIQSGCIAAAMMLHVTSEASGYFENMWAWVADHDLDDAQNTMVTVAVARGILDESSGATWYYGTASEHSMLYQYNFYGSTNTFAGMIQTESPYFQYTAGTESPGVFSSSVGLFENDPVFPDSSCSADGLLCNFSWAVMIQATTNLTIAGAGLYSWFDNYDQSVCVDAQNCQQRLINNQGANDQLYIWNLVTIGAIEMLSDTFTGTVIYAANNTQASEHPFWSILGAYLDSYGTEAAFCLDDDTDPECFVKPVCDLTLNYATLDDLQAAAGSWPDSCMDYYALGTLNSLLSHALDDYTSADDGYDSVWNYYVESVKDMVPSALSDFIAASSSDEPDGGPGNKFFSCDFVELPLETDKLSFNPCPVPYNQISYLDEYRITMRLECTSSIKEDCVGGGAGAGGGGNPNLDRRDCEKIDIEYVGVPVSSGDITVTNPKDVITAALPTLGDLQVTILGRQMDLMLGLWSGPTDDILQVVSMPVFLIVQAVASMKDAKAQGEKQKKEDRTKLILEILGIVFAFVPFLDEIAPEVEALDAIVEIVSAAGNVGLAIQGIIADPESAPMEILGALTGGVEKDEADMATLAKTRRGISGDDIGKIGSSFKDMDNDFQSIIKRTCAL
ncbi:LysM domain-containing protein [Seiridium cupressi]